jgi:hypothetical protein
MITHHKYVMHNVQLHKLLFNRSWATFDNFFPQAILNTLLAQVSQAEWQSHPKANRHVMDQLSVPQAPAIDLFLSEHVPQLIREWTGEHVEYMNYVIWRDTAGLEYKPHTDKRFEQREHHVQVYLTDGPAELGTGVHMLWDKWAWFKSTLAPYGMNRGIYLNTAHTVRHSVKSVPADHERISIRARYVKKGT